MAKQVKLNSASANRAGRRVNKSLKKVNRKYKKAQKKKINKLKALKKRADQMEEFINGLERQDFKVNPHYKELINKIRLTSRIKKSDYEKYRKELTKTRIKSEAYFTVTHLDDDKWDDSKKLNTPVRTNLTYSKFMGKKGAAAEINKALKYAQGNKNTTFHVMNERISNEAMSLAASYKGNQMPVPGDDNEYFKVSEKWDGAPETFGKYVTFKKVDYLGPTAKILSNAYASSDVHEEFLNTSQYRSYEKVAEDLGWTPEQIQSLEYLMNTSQAWNIAHKKVDAPSDQTLNVWENLGNHLFELEDEVNETLQYVDGATTKEFKNDVDKVKSAIMNEDKYDDIIRMIDDIIIKAIQTRGD